MPIEIKGSRLRVKVGRTVKDAVFRTHDIGHKKHTERIVMYNPKTKRWKTIGFTFPVKDIIEQRPETVKILRNIGYLGKAKKLVKKHTRHTKEEK